HDAVGGGHAAEPLHLLHVVTNGLAAEKLKNRRVLIDGSDHGAILRRHGIYVAGRGQRSRTRHVLHNDIWLSWNMISQVSAEQPRIDVITAAGRVAHNNRDRLASIEILRVLCMHRRKTEKADASCDYRRADHESDVCKLHRKSPLL